MSKKRHRDRSREEKCNCQHCRNKLHGNNGNNGNNSFGFNPAQLMSLLGGNMDFSNIGNVLSSMKSEGVDLSNFNLGSLQNSAGVKRESNNSLDINQLQSMLAKMDKGILEDEVDIGELSEDVLEDDEIDENIELLKNIKKIVDSNKAVFLDKIITAYRNGELK